MKIKTSILSLILTFSLFSAFTAAQSEAKDQKTKPEVPKLEKPATPAKPARAKNEPLDFPEVDGWTKGDVQKYPQAELGYSVNYDAKGSNRVTVYVYNGGRKDIRNSLAGAVKDEIEQAKSEIDAMAEMGVYSDVKVEKDEKTKVGGKAGKIDTLHKVLSFKARGNQLHSEIYIFPFEGNFVKIRATRPKAGGPADEEAVVRLLAEIEAMFVMYMDISDATRTALIFRR